MSSTRLTSARNFLELSGECVASVMWMKAIRLKPSASPDEVGVIAGDHLLLFQPHPPSRALRGRQADEIGQLLVGQPAVVLQRGQHFEVEGVHLDHA